MPPHDQFACTFDNLAGVVDEFTGRGRRCRHSSAVTVVQERMGSWGLRPDEGRR
jgi:hypothetical protein